MVLEPAYQPPAAQPISRGKMWLVFGLCAVIVLGHLADLALQREHWPYSNYPMWSFPSRGWEVKREMLRGVTDEPVPREIYITPNLIYPIPYWMVVVQMGRSTDLLKKGDARQAESVTQGLLTLYENRRKAHLHDGPPLKSIRLYQVTWLMNKDATEESKRNPIDTQLLYPPLSKEEKFAAVPAISTRLASEFGNDNSSD